jgi:photosystem II stability/assembly factor-like uncharacterized protein
LILSLGTVTALVVGETQGLALAEMSGAPVRMLAPAQGGDVFYAVLDSSRQPAGIYRSEDSGGTWQRMGSGPGAPVNSLVAHPAQDAFLYAGTAGGPAAATTNLWLSYDGGQTWRRSMLSLPSKPDGYLASVTALAVDRSQPEVLYVGTDGQGVYRMEASAATYGYELVGGVSLYNAHVRRLVVGPEGRVYALTSDGLFESSGGIWQKLPFPEMAASLAVSPQDSQILYAGGVSMGIYRSTDGGRGWERVSAGLDMPPGAALRVTALEVDEEDPYRVVAATSYGIGNRFTASSVYESRDGGASWAKLVEANGLVTQLTPGQGAIYMVGEGGLVRYGEQVEPLPAASSDRLRVGLPPLAKLMSNPSGIQVLILVLTVALAGLALVGRTEWILKKHEI